jgi:hypothetical protein
MTVAAAATLALLASSGGCEFVVSDALPSFTCLPGAANCPTGSVCAPDHMCVARSTACTPGASSGCAAGLRCNEDTLQCTPGPTTSDADASGDATLAQPDDSSSDAANGMMDVDAPVVSEAAPAGDAADGGATDAHPPDASGACRGIACSCTGRNADCDSGICAGQLTETSPLSTAVGSFCTQPCCTSADCPASTVCFGTGGGGNYCVMPSWIGRGTRQGAAIGGVSCMADGDCRSGLCSMGACADTCCSSAQQSCASGSVCQFAAFPGKSFDTHETAWCGSGIGGGAAGSPCALDSSCQSGKCSFSRCEAVCRSSADCVEVGLACTYAVAPTTVPSNPDIVLDCVTVTGTVANGSPCTASTDCLSAFCDGDHCTDVCVTNADCKPGLHCVPETVMVQGSYSVLCCES